jgi:hypothetical protein
MVCFFMKILTSILVGSESRSERARSSGGLPAPQLDFKDGRSFLSDALGFFEP